MEVEYRFVMREDYSLLPINVAVPRFATSNDCKQFMVVDTIVSLTTCLGNTQEDHGFMKKYMLVYKYTTKSSIRCITFNL